MGITVKMLEKEFGTSGKRKPLDSGKTRQLATALQSGTVTVTPTGGVYAPDSPELKMFPQETLAEISTEERSA